MKKIIALTGDILLILFAILFYKTYKQSKHQNDKAILVIGLLGSISYIIGRIIHVKELINVTHILYFFLIILIPFLAKEKNTLIVFIFVLLATIITRLIFKKCIFQTLQKNRRGGILTSYESTEMYDNLNWTNVSAFILIITSIRYMMI